jgi:hypothetical protein
MDYAQPMSMTAAFQYPPHIQRTVTSAALLLLAFNAVEFVLAWVRVIYGWLIPLLPLPTASPFALFDPVRFGLVAPTLITAHLGLLVALVIARAVAFLTPRIVPVTDGLLMETPLGTRLMRDDSLRGLRSVEMQPGGRFLVWVDAARGLPLHNLFAYLLMGRWSWRGFFLTSDLAGFDEVIGRIVASLKTKYGEEKFKEHFSEHTPVTLLAVASHPLQTIQAAALAGAPATTMRSAAGQMVSVALSLSIPLLAAAIIHAQWPWAALVVPLLALAEWPLASAYLMALSEGYTRKVTFDEALRAYPLTQLPRWVCGLLLTLLVVAGLPWLLYVPVLLSAIALGSMLVLKLGEDWFMIPFPSSLMVILVTAIYQCMLYAMFLALLPR